MYELDDLDRKIVNLMQRDGRISGSDAAKIVDTSEATFRRRLERLLEEGVIRIVAVPDPIKVGVGNIAVLMIHADPYKVSEVCDKLAVMKEIRFVGHMSGVYNVIAEAWFHSTEEMAEFLQAKLTQVSGIQKVDVSQALEMVKYAYDWGVGEVFPSVE